MCLNSSSNGDIGTKGVDADEGDDGDHTDEEADEADDTDDDDNGDDGGDGIRKFNDVNGALSTLLGLSALPDSNDSHGLRMRRTVRLKAGSVTISNKSDRWRTSSVNASPRRMPLRI